MYDQKAQNLNKVLFAIKAKMNAIEKKLNKVQHLEDRVYWAWRMAAMAGYPDNLVQEAREITRQKEQAVIESMDDNRSWPKLNILYDKLEKKYLDMLFAGTKGY